MPTMLAGAPTIICARGRVKLLLKEVVRPEPSVWPLIK